MDIELSIILEQIISNMNARQQSIARNILVDKKFRVVTKSKSASKLEVYIRNNISGEFYLFSDYVKSICGC